MLPIPAFPSVVQGGEPVHEGLDPTVFPANAAKDDRKAVVAMVIDIQFAIPEGLYAADDLDHVLGANLLEVFQVVPNAVAQMGPLDLSDRIDCVVGK